jgi:AraC-like DNA-binding protein
MEPLDALKNALDELVSQRDQLDEDIEDLRRIIGRRSGSRGSSTSPQPTAALATRRAEGRGAAPLPGEARHEILELMSNGKVWTPSQIAQRRGTSPNAASRAFKRMLSEKPPPIRQVGYAKYKLASPKGDDAQGSLSVAAEGEGSEP